MKEIERSRATARARVLCAAALIASSPAVGTHRPLVRASDTAAALRIAARGTARTGMAAPGTTAPSTLATSALARVED